MPREFKRDEIKRAAAAEQKRLRRAQMTEEELKKVRAAEAERVRQKRAQKSEEEQQRAKARSAALKHQRRAQMTEEELEERRAREAARKRQKRSAAISEEELQKLKARKAELHRQKRDKMTEEEREKHNAKLLQYNRRRKSQMTEEDKKNNRAKQTELQRRKMAGMTEEERERFRVKNAERLKRKLNGTTIERIEAFMSQAGELAYRHREKYEIHGTFIKDSFCEILNLYTEAGKLRKTLKKTVADAVKNAVRLHQIEKQTKAEGYRSLTFVEISTPPLNSKRTIKQELRTEDAEADPLKDQPGISNQEICASNEITTENSTKDQTDETFKVCSYDALGASAENSTGVNTSKKFECSICSKKFETSLGLTIHQKEHRNDSGEFKCCLCPQIFNDCNLMTTHYLELHSLEFDANAISSEPEDEETDEVLERHRHEFEFLFLRQCLICFQPFDRPVLSTYRNHILSNHSDNNELLKTFTYICARCDKPHAVWRSLESHWKTFCYEKWKNEDSNNRGIVCEKCGLEFSNEKSLTSHTSMSHDEKKKVVCEQCGKEFNDEKLVKIHLKIVHESKTGECIFTCEHCGKTFNQKSNLIKHTKNVHLGEKRFACNLCDKRFTTNYKVDQHMSTHTGEKIFQPSNHVCDICGKAFKSPSRLKDHKYTHDSLKQFGCSLCAKTFRQRSTFGQHRRKTHANEYAQIVNLISEKEAPPDVFANLLPMCNNDVSSTLYNFPDRRNSNNVSNMSLEPQYSPGREDYSPEMEYDSGLVEIEPLSQFQVGEIENGNLQNNISLPATNHQEHSTYLKHSVVETNIKDLQPSLSHSSTFIDFSRANVPLGVSTLTDVRSDAEVEKEDSKNISKPNSFERKPQNLKVFIEDSEQDSFVADLDMNDFVKIKIEARDGFHKESPKVTVKSEAAILAEENSSPCPIVKMTKLLEYDCIPCDKTIFMSSQRDIRKHRRTHSRNKSQKQKAKKLNSGDGEKKKMRCFDCLYCETKGLTGRTIIVHCAQEHPGLQPIKCPVCPRMFNSKDTYYNHKTKRHNPPKPKPPSADPNANIESMCEVCGKSFRTKQHMWVHKSLMHRGNFEVECDICHKMIRGKANMKLHRNRHLGIKPHLCEECGMSFCTPRELKEHVRVIHRGEKKRPKATYKKARRFPCLICPCAYVTETGLQKHMNFHDPERKYACDQCGFRYKTYLTRYVHINIKHKNIKPKRKSRKKPPADVLTISA